MHGQTLPCRLPGSYEALTPLAEHALQATAGELYNKVASGRRRDPGSAAQTPVYQSFVLAAGVSTSPCVALGSKCELRTTSSCPWNFQAKLQINWPFRHSGVFPRPRTELSLSDLLIGAGE